MLIGLDIGGTKIEGALIEKNDFNVRERFRVKTPKTDYPTFLMAVTDMINQVLDCEKAESSTIRSIGIGCCGASNTTTGLMQGANILCLNGHPFLKDIQNTFDTLPVAITNDGNSLAISEFYLGAAKEKENSCFSLIVGTGCGSGMIINKQIVDGPNGCAGEIGHNPLPLFDKKIDGEPYQCNCGAWNCNEFFVSGTGIERTYYNKFNEKKLAIEIFELAKTNKAVAAHVDLFIDQLARVLGNIVNTIDPEIIVLGGGVSNQQSIYPKLSEKINQYIFRESIETPIVPAANGDSSGVVGAALLPIMRSMI